MPLASFADYQTAMEVNASGFWFSKIIGNTISGFTSSWTLGNAPGATPTTAAALNGTTTGAMNSLSRPLKQVTGSKLYFGGAKYTPTTVTGSIAPTGILVDRLSHQGGLSGIVTSAQTTNLPTAALTRYTSGAGVMAALEIYTQIGTTATTATISYTNQAGTSGRTSQAMVFGGTGNRDIARTFIVPLDPADTGVQAVASVTVLATTGTAGAFGVTLFKPLAFLRGGVVYPMQLDALLNGGGLMQEIDENACLNLLGMVSVAISGARLIGSLDIIEVPD